MKVSQDLQLDQPFLTEGDEVQSLPDTTSEPRVKITQLLLFSTIANQCYAGGDCIWFDLVSNQSAGQIVLCFSSCGETIERPLQVVDGPSIAEAISSILETIGWMPAQTSCHDVVNYAPSLFPANLVRQIIARTLIDVREEDNAPTVDEFMAERYTESSDD